MFDEYIRKINEFGSLDEAKNWLISVIPDLVELKNAPGGAIQFKTIINRLVERWHGNGKTAFRKEIEGYIKIVEYQRMQDQFNSATGDKMRDKLNTNSDGVVLASLDNLVKLLYNNKYIEFSYDNFTERKIFKFTEQQLWHEGLAKNYLDITYPEEHGLTGLKTNRWYFVEGHLPSIKLYLHQFFPEERRWHELEDAIDIVCQQNQIDLYQDWLDNGLPEWDGLDRMDFLHRHAGVENKEWARVIGHSIFLSMVARCYEPGYDFRGVAILEGAENIGKSWLVRSLAFDERFFTPFTFNRNNEGYEPARQMRGQVMIELPDKGGMDSRTADQIKAFLTFQHDLDRPMNKNAVEHLKRRFTMIITCNESGQYLKGDQDGDTRFMPCRCYGKINVETIIAEKMQIFAQAKYLYEMGISPRLTDAELVLQQRFVKPRQVKSDYFYHVLEILKQNRKQMVHEWDDGFTKEEMLGWFHTNYDWSTGIPKPKLWSHISSVLKQQFHFKMVNRRIPAIRRKEGDPDQVKKWRYDGPKEFNSFLDSLEDE